MLCRLLSLSSTPLQTRNRTSPLTVFVWLVGFSISRFQRIGSSSGEQPVTILSVAAQSRNLVHMATSSLPLCRVRFSSTIPTPDSNVRFLLLNPSASLFAFCFLYHSTLSSSLILDTSLLTFSALALMSCSAGVSSSPLALVLQDLCKALSVAAQPVHTRFRGFRPDAWEVSSNTGSLHF